MEENMNKPIHGIRISTINYAMIFLSCILYILLIYATVQVSLRYEDLSAYTDDYIACQKNSTLVSEGSDYLTQQVQLYVATMDPQYVKAYFMEIDTIQRRETGLAKLKEHANPKAYEYLKNALDASNQLMEQEVYAMKLIATANGSDMSDFPQVLQELTLTPEDQALPPNKMIEKARTLVLDSGYQEAKNSIMKSISDSLEHVVASTQQEQLNSASNLKKTMLQQRILTSILFVLNIIIFILIIVLVIKPLQTYIQCINEERELDIIGSYEFRYLAYTYNNMCEVNIANETMLRHQAEHDPLTGINNRGAFNQAKQLLKTKQLPLALLIIDVDKFKHVNDGYGHEMGDTVLKSVAKLLEDSFRNSDFPARIGGDEFAVILTDATSEMEPLILEKITKINEILQNPPEGVPQVSLSVGVAFSESGFSDDLYKNADSALYEVKKHGRCGCRFYKEPESQKPDQLTDTI